LCGHFLPPEHSWASERIVLEIPSLRMLIDIDGTAALYGLVD
jgi:hypothetical protein